MNKTVLYETPDIPLELSPCIPLDTVSIFYSLDCPTVQRAYALLSDCKDNGRLDELLPALGTSVEPLEKIISDIEACFVIDKSHPAFWLAD